MADATFLRNVPDIKDIDNRTGECPGYSTAILKDDTCVGITLTPVGDPDPINSSGIALSIEDAKAFLEGLQKAIESITQE